jgi:hypothetical protein
MHKNGRVISSRGWVLGSSGGGAGYYPGGGGLLLEAGAGYYLGCGGKGCYLRGTWLIDSSGQVTFIK